MKHLLYTICIVCTTPIYSIAQTNTGMFALTQSAPGSINIPALQDLRVTVLDNAAVKFEGSKDFSGGKHVSSHYQLKVISNIPWYVSVRASDPFLTPLTNTTANDVPVSIVRLKPNSTSKYINLSTAPQTVLVSDNMNLVNTYYIDLKFDPSWNLPGGSYNIPIEFTLSPQ